MRYVKIVTRSRDLYATPRIRVLTLPPVVTILRHERLTRNTRESRRRKVRSEESLRCVVAKDADSGLHLDRRGARRRAGNGPKVPKARSGTHPDLD